MSADFLERPSHISFLEAGGQFFLFIPPQGMTGKLYLTKSS